MNPIFRWPRSIETPGLITVTGRHQTPALRKLGYGLTAATGVAMMIHSFFGASSIVNRTAVEIICFFCPSSSPGDVGAWWLIAQFFVGTAIGAGGSNNYFNLYALILQTWTTVRIAADRVEIHGVSYPRSAREDLQFVTTSSKAVRMQNDAGESLTMGSMEEGRTLRLAYGRCNSALITIFLKPQHASRFALACNAALQAEMPPTRGFEVLTAIPLDEEQAASQPIPAKVRSRREIKKYFRPYSLARQRAMESKKLAEIISAKVRYEP